MKSPILGQLLDHRYLVVRNLASGGFGQTYVAEDTRRPGNPQCVVKHLKPASTSPQFLGNARRLFATEAEILERLGNHDQIPRLLAYFEEEEEFFVVQELVEGHPLSQELVPGQVWAEAQILNLLWEVLQALVFVHSHHVIHRDIKPENLIRRHHDGKLVLVDFGTVKQIRTQAIIQGQATSTIAVGTPGYMPTEQSHGKPRQNSDIYALGVLALQASTGLHPSQFQEDSQTGELIWKPKTNLSPQLFNILRHMVRYHFKDRCQSATEVLQALEPLIQVNEAHIDHLSMIRPDSSFIPLTSPSGQLRGTFKLPDPRLLEIYKTLTSQKLIQTEAPDNSYDLVSTLASSPFTTNNPPVILTPTLNEPDVILLPTSSPKSSEFILPKSDQANKSGESKCAENLPRLTPTIESERSNELTIESNLDAKSDVTIHYSDELNFLDASSEHHLSTNPFESAISISPIFQKSSTDEHPLLDSSLKSNSFTSDILTTEAFEAINSEPEIFEAITSEPDFSNSEAIEQLEVAQFEVSAFTEVEFITGSSSEVEMLTENGASTSTLFSDGTSDNVDVISSFPKAKPSPYRKFIVVGGGILTLSGVVACVIFLIQHQSYLQTQRILDAMTEAKQSGQYDECIQKMSALSQHETALYRQAQVVRDDCLLEKAQNLASMRKLKDAIAQASQVPASAKSYQFALQLIAQWSEEILKVASDQYRMGNFEQAKIILGAIQPSSKNAQNANQMLKQWEIEWLKNEALLKAATLALEKQSWQKALDAVDQIQIMNQPVAKNTIYWQSKIQPIKTRAEQEIAEAIAKESAARESVPYSSPQITSSPSYESSDYSSISAPDSSSGITSSEYSDSYSDGYSDSYSGTDNYSDSYSEYPSNGSVDYSSDSSSGAGSPSYGNSAPESSGDGWTVESR
jgi:serine/threonine protein kinase